MSLYVTQDLGLDVLWAGVALGVAAALEIPALLVIGRLSGRVSNLALIATGCVVGIADYVARHLRGAHIPGAGRGSDRRPNADRRMTLERARQAVMGSLAGDSRSLIRCSAPGETAK